jgi:hypothetical protein
MPQMIINYPVDLQPHVEVEIDGAWVSGEVHEWELRRDGAWWARCLSHHDATDRIGYFPACRIRPDMTKYPARQQAYAS